MFYGFTRSVSYVQWVCTAANGMHNRLTPNLNCPIIPEKVKKTQLLTLLCRFPNSSPLDSLLSQINAVHILHSLSIFPVTRDIPTDQVYAGFLTKSSYVLLAFFVHLAPLSTILIICGKSWKSWSSTRCGLHRAPVTSNLLGPNILMSLFSNYRMLRRSFLLRNENWYLIMSI
jgi:hypothetical protein